jgi:hypothetical protein
MKLRTILEIQRKSPTTTMDRANTVGSYAVGSIQDFLHLVHDGDGHAQTNNSTEATNETEQETDRD